MQKLIMRDYRKTGPKPRTPQALGELDHHIIATVREPLIVLDGDLRVISANDSFYRTFKVLRRWTDGRLIFEIGKRQWDIPRLRKLLENVLLTDQQFQDFEVEHDFPKLGRRTMLLNARRLTRGKGDQDLILLAIEDVTERKRQEVERQRLLAEQEALAEELATTNEELQVQAEELIVQAEELTVQKEELERLNVDLMSKQQRLEAANEDLESFSYSVSHDLKAPVRAIDGFSRMLMGEHADKLDAEALRLLQVINSNTKLMQHLIDDLLALSRLGRLQVRKSVVDLSAMARQVFGQLRGQAPERDLRLTGGDLPLGWGDQSLLYQVMQNLLANAVKFTKSRKTAIIEVGGRTEGKENIYYVKDNGAGFDERYIDNLFRPFQRLHPQEEYEGTGVGLAILQRIIQRHGGRVWAEGKVGEGATFYFSLTKNED
jgi:signal transduction histidine kinase